MVALTSRFTLLAALCALTFVTPLVTNAAMVERRHSDKSINSGVNSSAREKHTVKQPVIPLPRKSGKRGRKEPKGKGKERQRRFEWPASVPLVDLPEVPVETPPKLQQRHEDDCPRKVIVNGDRDHVRLKCHRDHDHHDHHDHHDYEKVIVNGDRDHVRTRRDTFQPRSPRHTRPLYQRRNETMAHGPSPKGIPGVVQVWSTDAADGQDKIYGEFIAKESGGVYDVEVSSTNQTVFYMVDASSTTPKSGSQTPITLQALLPDYPDAYCCSYNPNPGGPQPMTMEVCRGDAGTDPHLSQVFLFDPARGDLQPMWQGGSGDSGVANSGSNQTSSQTAGDQTQNKGDKSVKMIWKPLAQTGAAKLEPSSGPLAGTKTVTVTVTVNDAATSSSALREAFTTLSKSISAEPTALSSPITTDGSFSTQTAAPTSTAQGITSPTGEDGLKVEVIPTQLPSAPVPSMSSSSTAAESTTTSSDSNMPSGVPAREGQILETVIAQE